MISNCFCHLLHCPRSFAKSQCSLFGRKYVLTRITKPKNFEEFKFAFRDRLNFKEISSLSFDELATIMSDRCLRILMNYCCKFVELLPECQEIRFVENI